MDDSRRDSARGHAKPVPHSTDRGGGGSPSKDARSSTEPREMPGDRNRSEAGQPTLAARPSPGLDSKALDQVVVFRPSAGVMAAGR